MSFGPGSRLAMADVLPKIVKPASELAISQYTVGSIRRGGVWRPAIMTWIPPE